MNNKTKSEDQDLVWIGIKLDNFENKISLCFDVTQHVRRAYRIIKPLCHYITKHKITTNH